MNKKALGAIEILVLAVVLIFSATIAITEDNAYTETFKINELTPKILRGPEGNVARIEFELFHNSDVLIRQGWRYEDPLFESLYLAFMGPGLELSPDIRVGGVCDV